MDNLKTCSRNISFNAGVSDVRNVYARYFQNMLPHGCIDTKLSFSEFGETVT